MTTKANTLTKRTTSPFRFDVVGSFLRPADLKQARQDFSNKKITASELKKVEDNAIIDLIHKEEKAGLQSITDGELRRSWWHLDFFWGLTGIKKAKLDKGYVFNDEETRPETAQLTGKISGENHPFVEHFKFLYANLANPATAKQTVPAPAQLIAELYRPENIETTKKYYQSEDELIEDIANAYTTVINDLFDAGLRVLQLDDCTWGMLAGFQNDLDHGSKDFTQKFIDESKALYVKINNETIDRLPKDLIVNTHDCRGNYHSTWASSGSYDSIADPLFTQEHIHAFFLEYDSDRDGGFEPLAQVHEDQLVVLGLITSKNGVLEDKDAIKARIKQAEKYVPLDRLCLSTQCGFSSTEEGNIFTEDQQWAKIALVKEIAKEVWG